MRSTRPSPTSRPARTSARSLANSRLRPSKVAADTVEVEAPPPLVAGERLRVAGVEPEADRVGDALGERGDVAEREVQSLAGDRMHAVRRIADEREPCRDVAARQMHLERPRLARAGERDLAELAAEPLFHLGEEALIVEREDAPGLAGVLRPGDAGAVAGERQDRERTRRQEVLHRARPRAGARAARSSRCPSADRSSSRP